MNPVHEASSAPGRTEAEAFEMTTVLAEGCEGAYANLHAAIPAPLGAAMRAAGVTGWTIHRNGLVLRHQVTAVNLLHMDAALKTDSENRCWQDQVNPLLDTSTSAPDPSTISGPWNIVWDFSWPVR